MRLKRPREASFTLLETMMAMTLMVTITLKVAGTQASMIYNSQYGIQMSQAIWLARSLMSKVEYFYNYQPLKELESTGRLREAKFTDLDLPDDSPFTFNLTVEEWKFPFLDILGQGGVSDSEEDGGGAVASSGGSAIKDTVEGLLGDDILKVAYIEVLWPDGARKNSVSLTYLLPNQRKLDELMKTYKADYDAMVSVDQQPKNDEDCKKRDKKKPYYNTKTKKCQKARPPKNQRPAGSQNDAKKDPGAAKE